MSVAKKTGLQDFAFEQLAKETVEIQAENNEQVAIFSSQWAANKYNLPIIKEDVGFYIEALGGFPGPYLNQVEKQIESEGYLKLLDGIQNRKAHWQYSIAFCEPKKRPIVFSAHLDGVVANSVKGQSGWFTDKIFIPDKQTQTISELLDEKIYRRNNNHYVKLFNFLKKQKPADHKQ